MGQAGQQRSRQKKLGSTANHAKTVKPTVEKKTPKLRKKIQPGTGGQVLILLASKFRGRRVVFLKQLESGMLLVTGQQLGRHRSHSSICIPRPYALNGVPMKRVNQRYCIATSTKVDVSGAEAGINLSGGCIPNQSQSQTLTSPATSADKSMTNAVVKELLRTQQKKDGQKKLDESIVKGLKDDVKSYLKSRFSLSANMYPHELKF
eukprot:Skav204206  [mRNA]  locus=scaffold985:253409:262113:- [translate_table: standard]